MDEEERGGAASGAVCRRLGADMDRRSRILPRLLGSFAFGAFLCLGLTAQETTPLPSTSPDASSLAQATSASSASPVTSASAGGSVSSSPLAEGERLFRDNKPTEAIPKLEQAVRDPGVDENAWIWLAICYQQLNRYDNAAATLRKGLAKSLVHKDLFWFDLGNLFLVQGKASFAKEMFDSAITVNSAMADAFLNRANAQMLLQDYAGASSDYSRYLVLEPDSPQKDSIQALLDLLGKTLAAEEQKKAEEDAARIAAETARKNLLDEVSSSLKASAEETTNLAAGSGQVQGYGDELPPSD